MASTLKVDTITTPDGTGNITTERPLSGSGASLTNLNATNLASGTVPTARLGSGTASSSTFLRGDQTYAEAGGGAWNYISSATASASSSLDFTSGIDSTYDVYLFSCVDLEFSANCEIRVRTGAGSFDTGASDYEIAALGYATYGNQPFGDDADDAIIISKASYQGGTSSDTYSASLRIFLYAPSDTTHLKKIEFCFIGEDSNGRAQFQVGVGQRSSTSAITRLQLYPHTGTITSGTIRMYGLAKS